MKKILSIALLAALMLPAVVTAQEKESVQYLPEKGDFAIGFDVVPLLRTIGGAFNKAQDVVPIGGSAFTYDELYLSPNVSIMGKYMITDSWGIKANLGLAMKHNSNRGYIEDDLQMYLDPTSSAKVIDTENITRFGGTLMAGAEYRLGKRKVQGVFGAGILFGASTYKANYTYGNAITELNQNPSAYFGPAVGVALPAGYRVTSLNSRGPNFTIGAYGSAGFEWFVAPKISLGGEVDLYVYGCMATQGNVHSEGFNQAYRKIEQRTDLYTPGNRGVSFGTDNVGGQIYMSFYF